MPYGILKADTLTYYTATGDVSVAISGIATSGSPLISGVSGVFTTSVSGATVTGNAGQFTTITGGTVNFTNITGVSGTFTSRISGATVTGTSGQFTTITATTGVFTTSISGATISGDVGLFNTISGNQGVFNSSLSVPSGTAASPSISFNGDPNTGIYSSGADAVAISTNGTGRLFIDSSGRVGVGVTPGGNYLLEAGSTASASARSFKLMTLAGGFSGGDYPYFGYNLRATGSSGAYNYDANDVASAINFGPSITFSTAASGTAGNAITWNERLRITSDGKLGLGTSSPSVLLTAAVADNTQAAQFRGATGYLRIRPYVDATNGALIDSTNTAESAYAPLTLYGSTARLFGNNGTGITVDSSGRVGVGTTTPSQKLSVAGGNILIDSNSQLRFGSSDAALIEGSGSDGTGGIRYMRFLVNNEVARFDSFGRLLVGTSNARSNDLFGTSQIQLEGTDAANSSIQIIRNSNNTGAGGIALCKSRSASNGGVAVVQSGDVLGFIDFQGTDGTDLARAATIEAVVDGTPGNNDMPGRLVFSTTADGASSPTERVRISQNGVVTVKNGAVAEIGTLTDGATVTPDFAANCNFTLTISGNRTLANPTNITAGQTGSIFIIQGSGSNTLSWGSYWDFAGGTAPTLSTASGAVDRVDYVVRTSTSIHTVFTANYS